MKRPISLKWPIFILSLGIGAALFFWLLARTGFAETFETLSSFGVLPFFGFVIISLVNFSLFVWRWRIIVNNHKGESKRISFWTLGRHRMSGYAMSYLTPSAQVGGEPLRAALLTKEGISGRAATSSVILDIAFELTGFVIFISAALIIALAKGLFPTGLAVITIVSISLIGLILFMFYGSTLKRRGFLSRIVRFFHFGKIGFMKKLEIQTIKVEDQMCEFLHDSPRRVPLILTLSIVTIAFKAVEILYLAAFLGVSLTFTQAILASGIPSLSMIVPVPAGIGLLEGSTAAVFAGLGVEINAVALILIVRLRDVVFVSLGATNVGHSLQDWLRSRTAKKFYK